MDSAVGGVAPDASQHQHSESSSSSSGGPREQQQQLQPPQQRQGIEGGGSSEDTGEQQQQRRRRQRQRQGQGQAGGRPVEQRVLTVGPKSDLAKTAQLLVRQLDAFGSAQLWCTGVTSQVYGVGVLVTAQETLARSDRGLVATVEAALPDGDTPHEKRSIKKLIFGVVPGPAPDPSDWPAGGGVRTSTARVRDAAALAGALRAGLAGPEARHALEARGEQAVNRALRALLSVQAELGEPLAVWPWYGAVENVGAAARGEAPKSVPGTVLAVRRISQAAAAGGGEE